MNRYRISTFALLASLVLTTPIFAQAITDEVPGAVRMKSGLILRGLCGRTDTISPLLESQRLELRVVEQQVRTYYVSTRQSDSVSPDNQVMPRQEFKIRQRRKSLMPMQYRIGLHFRPPFDAAGKSFLELRLPAGVTKKLELGITAVNSQHVTVSGLTHRWEYWIDISQIPDATLYSNGGRPCLLRMADGFADGQTQLNMAQMLLEGEKYIAAQSLIGDIQASFPDLSDKCDRLAETWNDSFGQRVVDELNRLRDTGKTVSARKYARLWPDGKLASVIKVRANAVQKQLDEEAQRITGLREAISAVLAEIEDLQIRRDAMRMWNQVNDQITPVTLDRFGAFELFADSGLPESRFALAMTGWLLGTNDAFDNFVEADGLFRIREMLTSYLQTEPDQDTERNRLVAEIRQQEGFSVERVAAVLKSLPPSDSLVRESGALEPTIVAIAATDDAVGGTIQVPAEYSPLRRYPLLVAFPQGGVSASDTLKWWSQKADQNGYLLVVPQLYTVEDPAYGASAAEHLGVLKLLRQVKAGLSVDDNRVYVAGHGIGGEAAMDIAASHPDIFAGMISLGGRGRRHVQWTAHNSMSLPWYIVVGSRQPGYYTRLEYLLRKLFRRSPETKQHSDVLFARYRERGFEPFSEELPKLFDWMEVHRRDPHPADIDSTILRSSDSSWWWIQLQDIPSRFHCLDAANTAESRPTDVAGRVPGSLSVSVSKNLIRFTSLPADGYIRLSPEMPGIDLEQSLNIRVGRKSQKIDYRPSIRDMLEDFYENRDRERLSYMKIPIAK